MTRPRKDPLLDFRFSDAVTFLAVRRHGSLSAAARELAVTPSQVSKAIARLEGQLATVLLKRTSHGVELSDEAGRIAPLLEQALARLRDARRDEPAPSPVLTIAAPSFVMPTLCGAMARALPQMRVRALQLAPAEIRSKAARDVFDVAVNVGAPISLESWETLEVGALQSSLFATPVLAQRLGPAPVSVERVRQERFVSPVGQSQGQPLPLDDGCPLPYGERKLGHETQTLSVALELAIVSHQLVYGPVLAAIHHIATGKLVPVPVKGWAMSEPLHVMLHVDRVTAPVRNAVLKEAQALVDGARLESVSLPRRLHLSTPAARQGRQAPAAPDEESPDPG